MPASGQVPVCQRHFATADGNPPMTASQRRRPDDVRSTLCAPPPMAEARSDITPNDSRTGARSTRHDRPPAAEAAERHLAPRIPDDARPRYARCAGRPKPPTTSRTSTLGRVPGHHDMVGAPGPKPQRPPTPGFPDGESGRGTLAECRQMQPQPRAHIDSRTGCPTAASTFAPPLPEQQQDARVTNARTGARSRHARPARPKPDTALRTSTLGRCPVAGHAIGSGRNRRRSRAPRLADGCPVERHDRLTTAAKQQRASRNATPDGRPVVAHTMDRPNRSWRRPTYALRAHRPWTVPDRRRAFDLHEPKPEVMSRTPTPGRVSPFPLIQLTIERAAPCSRRVRHEPTSERRRPKPPAHVRWNAQHVSTDTSSTRDRSGESASHTAQKRSSLSSCGHEERLTPDRAAMSPSRRAEPPRFCDNGSRR